MADRKSKKNQDFFYQKAIEQLESENEKLLKKQARINLLNKEITEEEIEEHFKIETMILDEFSKNEEDLANNQMALYEKLLQKSQELTDSGEIPEEMQEAM